MHMARMYSVEQDHSIVNAGSCEVRRIKKRVRERQKRVSLILFLSQRGMNQVNDIAD